MERRQFIRSGCKLCMGIAGAAMLPAFLESCSPLPIYNTSKTDHKVAVPLTEFANTNFVIVRARNLNYDIAVMKQTDGSYKSVYMQCTHADNPVDFNGNEFNCSLHGSIFSKEGQVKRGPAEKPLLTLNTQVSDSEIVITI